MAIYPVDAYTLRRVLRSLSERPINAGLMSANHQLTEGVAETAGRDRLLRRSIACFAAAAFLSFALAVGTSLWQQAGGDLEPVSLAQDAPR